mmetsp:Transcript_3890/g.24641  ORF Transcript_3890/g.24641 Transcript_3890/m.24641 type:complete len:321 (-) Transcript_3890:2648-3610(-)
MGRRRLCTLVSNSDTLGWTRANEITRPWVWDQLEKQGYAVVESFLKRDACKQLRSTIDQLRCDRLVPNATHFVAGDGSRELLVKSQIFETETHVKGILEQAPCLSLLHNDTSLRERINQGMPTLNLQSHSVKLQYNAGKGGCFPMHFDSEPTVDARVMTAIIYLNEGWVPSSGGQLRLYPFPNDPIDVEPTAGKLVLFSSRNMLHRVLPSSRERYCITLWLSKAARENQIGKPLRPPLKEGSALNPVLENLEFRRLLAKAVYAQEWADSLVESHPDNEGRQLALQKHWKDVNIIKFVFRHILPRLEELKRSKGKGLVWFS